MQLEVQSEEVLITMVAGTVLLLLLVVVIIIASVRYQNRKRSHLMDLQRIKHETEREILRARVEEHEETLNWLSKELHDNIGQLLTSSKMLIGTAERSAPPNEILQLANDTLARAIVELRAMSKSLNKEWLERFSLLENLHAEAARINSSHTVRVSINAPPALEMAGDRQLMLFRIAQEAIQNSLKHSKAREIKVHLECGDAQLRVIVEDNGNGFDAARFPNQGIGITNIKQRTEVMGGIASWHSSPQGTKVEIKLPANP